MSLMYCLLFGTILKGKTTTAVLKSLFTLLFPCVCYVGSSGEKIRWWSGRLQTAAVLPFSQKSSLMYLCISNRHPPVLQGSFFTNISIVGFGGYLLISWLLTASYNWGECKPHPCNLLAFPLWALTVLISAVQYHERAVKTCSPMLSLHY